ncbi:hypothetical protein M3196_13910 [Fictibacillus nanhaiensis]|uniref:hypothetical protein n=1 Tax=Fictibacillus nanhaiensis TaxID=742169 RepID=UPI00203D2370|nr:hypothetical protein [Fictibacillus nanhaiensis]MCM3732745.1 hypothetical protein [Fictibacillus nanhaiensis]
MRNRDKGGDDEMATSTLYEKFTLTEATANKILETSRTILPEINVFNDIKLNEKDRIAHAANILKSRKCK